MRDEVDMALSVWCPEPVARLDVPQLRRAQAMSLFDYRAAVVLWRQDPPFYSLIMAAMYRADSTNAEKLAAAFPATWAEVNARYHAPGGVLEGETVDEHS